MLLKILAVNGILVRIRLNTQHSCCDPNPFSSKLSSPEFRFFFSSLLASFIFSKYLVCPFRSSEWQFYYLANIYLVRVSIPLYSKNNSPHI